MYICLLYREMYVYMSPDSGGSELPDRYTMCSNMDADLLSVPSAEPSLHPPVCLSARLPDLHARLRGWPAACSHLACRTQRA